MESERVLIVEDEKIIALDLQRRLERFGYTVCDSAAEGEEAVRKARDHRPDIILMDIMLAGAVDGIEAAKTIKRELQIPVIFLTAYADERTLERAKEAEPFGYILKPFKERELYTTIDIALYKHKVDKSLKKQERLFSAILHSVNDGIVATGIDMEILFLNPIAAKMCGWTEDDARGRSAQSVLSLVDSRSLVPVVPDTLPGGGHPMFFRDVMMKSRHGQTFIVDGSITKIHQIENETEGYVFAFRDISELKRMSETIDYQASHDGLTGLSNREEFALKLSELIDELKRNGGRHTLIELDIDRFKVVNDTCGAMAGDELLRQVANVIQSLTQRRDFSARLGGDEFAVILRDCTLEDSLHVAKRLQDAVQNHKFIWQKSLFPITLSIGVVPLSEGDQDIHAVLAAADDACYIAKEEGGNRISVFQRSEEKYVQRRGQMEWIGRINEALERNMFRLWFQPIEPLNPEAGHHAKAEILIRMQGDDGSIISPGSFIPSAERYGLMPMIDRWVLDNSVKTWRRLKDEGHPIIDRLFTVNLSGPTLLDETFVEYVDLVFKRYEGSPASFCFEITETAAIQNLSYASNFMGRLKDKGFTFSLDDFGSGFSSFNYLKNLPVDYLKIDGSIVQNIDESLVNYTMVDSINSMGHVLGLKTVGEYAKNMAIVDRLRRIGVDYAQGYALAEPKPLP
ncbi:MAG: two-component system response regulator [Treponema sp. GWB1_62_6]|nr:MAG: two-component system response regulator [Treponema sp. GWB1_62_6]OHE69136.1 MAG: two-component system response regulator [Treponema sp. GWC1_61_84]OHE75406.1 MAG: two-component system response regulator [Treponema sp. RIFOXYC1_FULL_61_9]HCM27063.1 two-component system response regulator [Treponema sp.]